MLVYVVKPVKLISIFVGKHETLVVSLRIY